MKSGSAYDPISAWYDAMVRDGSPSDQILIPHLLGLADKVRGLSILDLGCGQGNLSRILAQGGATVTGVDISERLIDCAIQEAERAGLSIRYVVDDAQGLCKLEDNTFDGVICHMSLMDMTDLRAVFAAARRVLISGGWFIFSITHPCFQTPHAKWVELEDGRPARQVNGYFEEGFWKSDYPHGVRGKVGAHHRMLSTYLNALMEAGFVFRRLVEPRSTGDAIKQVSGYAEVPPFLAIRSVRAG